jgi:predicted transglutaminase-like cysteine proteinase
MVALVTLALATGLTIADADMRATLERISFDTPTLAPMAYTQFCLRYPGECRTRKLFRGGPVRLSVAKRIELAGVNDAVNAGIVPQANLQGLAGEVWLIGPDRGDCNDYAVTKRHALMQRGWPARALLLSEVVTTSGEHHLVLVVRTSEGDLVLDNLTDKIKPWFRTRYQWVRMQMPGVSKLWTTIASRAV